MNNDNNTWSKIIYPLYSLLGYIEPTNVALKDEIKNITIVPFFANNSFFLSIFSNFRGPLGLCFESFALFSEDCTLDMSLLPNKLKLNVSCLKGRSLKIKKIQNE